MGKNRDNMKYESGEQRRLKATCVSMYVNVYVGKIHQELSRSRASWLHWGFELATSESQRTPLSCPACRNWNHLIKKFPV